MFYLNIMFNILISLNLFYIKLFSRYSVYIFIIVILDEKYITRCTRNIPFKHKPS